YLPSSELSCTVPPTVLDFGYVSIGSVASKTFTVYNTGQGLLNGMAIADSSEVSLADPYYSILPGGSAVLTVRVDPYRLGPRTLMIGSGLSICDSVQVRFIAYYLLA